MKHVSSGFTLVEALVAVVVLGVGIIALVSASASVTRMIGRGKMETRAAQVASERMAIIRSTAGSTSPRCQSTALVSGGPVISGGVTERWEVSAPDSVRQVTVSVTYLTVRGLRTAKLQSSIAC
jgi:Tfp pilus assembly protein PilV